MAIIYRAATKASGITRITAKEKIKILCLILPAHEADSK